jgi:hypothetical protein
VAVGWPALAEFNSSEHIFRRSERVHWQPTTNTQRRSNSNQYTGLAWLDITKKEARAVPIVCFITWCNDLQVVEEIADHFGDTLHLSSGCG